MLLGLIFIDAIIRKRGFDLGYLPYILANACFACGGWYLARRKGYTPYVGLIGMTSLFGLAVLFLLTDRSRARPFILFSKSTGAAFLSIALSIYWVWGYQEKRSALDQVVVMDRETNIKRSEYPEEALACESPTAFENEIEKMSGYVEKGISTLGGNDYGPDDIGRLAELTFFRLSEFFIWLNYQQYLYLSKTGDLPEQLTEENIHSIKIRFKKQLQRLLKAYPELDSNPRFFRVYFSWVMSCQEWDIVSNQCMQNSESIYSLDRYLWGLHSYFQKVNNTMTEKTPDWLHPPDTPTDLIASVSFQDDGIVDIQFEKKTKIG